jgi:hypothetical protein
VFQGLSAVGSEIFWKIIIGGSQVVWLLQEAPGVHATATTTTADDQSTLKTTEAASMTTQVKTPPTM